MLKRRILSSIEKIKKEIFCFVRINEEKIFLLKEKYRTGIKSLTKKIKKGIKSHLLENPQKTLNFLFLIRTLDFSLWKNKNYFYSDLKNHLFKIFKEHQEPEKFLLGLRIKEFRKLFKLTEDVFTSEVRLKLLKEKIEWLKKEQRGNFYYFLKKYPQPEKFCFNLFRFNDFQDFYRKKQGIVYILKPNQLLYFACQKALEEFGEKTKYLNELTVFADNVLPAVLYKEGVLQYNRNLEKKVKKGMILKYGSYEEVALRCATLLACERIAQLLNLDSWQVDQLLWAGGSKGRKIITHKTPTLFY